MIVTRLILHRRNIRKAIGASGGAGGLYTAVVTMLIESYALYAATFLTYVVPWSSNSYVASSVSTLLASVQVCGFHRHYNPGTVLSNHSDA